MRLEENKYYVYSLIDPINNIPFYIGKCCGNRAYSHLKNIKEGNINKNKMIENIRLLGFEPRVEFISENLFEDVAYDIEYCIIKTAKYYGISLTNKVGLLKPPSRKNSIVSDETRRKISIGLKGKQRNPMSEETKQKLSIINKGKEGPNKVFIDNIEELKTLYVIQNKTKKDLCNYYTIGIGSLNRILSENNIMKTKECFSDYSKRKSY